MARIITVGGLPYNLHDVDDQIKLEKIARTTWGVVPEWVLHYIHNSDTSEKFDVYLETYLRERGSDERN